MVAESKSGRIANPEFHRLLRLCVHEGGPLTVGRLAKAIGSGRSHVTEVLLNKPGHGHQTRKRLATFFGDKFKDLAPLILESLGWDADGKLLKPIVPHGETHVEHLGRGGMTEAICKQCGATFAYELKGRRGKDFCPACLRQRRKNAVEQWRTKTWLPKVDRELHVGQFSREDQQGYKVEMAVLKRIRAQHPELMELYQDWIAAGRPTPAEGSPDTGKELLRYLLELDEWYDLRAELLSQGMRPEAQELLDLIKQCYSRIREQVEVAYA